MLLLVRHRTVYTYEGNVSGAMQIVRLTPRPFPGLIVHHWRVKGEDRKPLPMTSDGFGNILHIHQVSNPRERTAIFVEGEVETQDTCGVVGSGHDSLPPSFFLRQTGLTRPDAGIVALAAEVRGDTVLDRLHELMRLVRERVDFCIGVTHVGTTASEALVAGAGVCQDHAHLFLACARILGMPARYVSGYLHTGRDDEEASHAWVEAFVDGLGWVGFDPANAVCPGENYIRTAIGLDYWSAAPVRGIWGGAGRESLDVRVRVEQVQSQQ